jgi:outer membrane protein assembly factor BamB
MKTSELIFVGIKGSVLALHRSTGDIIWQKHLKGWDFVTVMLEEDTLYAVTYGEIFCLDASTGSPRWHNPLKGFGVGLATLALAHGSSEGQPPVLAEKRRRDQAEASSSNTASGSAG